MTTDNPEILRQPTADTTKPLPPPAKSARSWNPARLFADYAFAARAWALVAIGAVILAVIQPFFIINAYRTRGDS